MVRKCIYCRKRVIENSGRTFHQFPKDVKRRQKWLDALNLTKPPNFKTASVCSDHFKEEDFFFPNNMTIRRKLRSHSVPHILLINTGESEGVTFEDIKVFSDGGTVSGGGEIKSFETLNESYRLKGIKLENEGEIEEESANLEVTTHPMINYIKTESVSTSEDNSQKSEHSPSRENRSTKKIRFIHKFKTEYISRADFVSDEAWEKFLRLYTHQKLKMGAAYSRDYRRRKLKSVKHVSLLKKEEEFNASF